MKTRYPACALVAAAAVTLGACGSSAPAATSEPGKPGASMAAGATTTTVSPSAHTKDYDYAALSTLIRKTPAVDGGTFTAPSGAALTKAVQQVEKMRAAAATNTITGPDASVRPATCAAALHDLQGAQSPEAVRAVLAGSSAQGTHLDLVAFASEQAAASSVDLGRQAAKACATYTVKTLAGAVDATQELRPVNVQDSDEAYVVVRTTKSSGTPLETVTGNARVGKVQVVVERLRSGDVAKLQADLEAAVKVLRADQAR